MIHACISYILVIVCIHAYSCVGKYANLYKEAYIHVLSHCSCLLSDIIRKEEDVMI